MSGILISILAFVVAIVLLVAVHEYGHYWVARKLGIKVLRFSIGFGKPIWKRASGPDQTEFVIANIPLGGYVKMLDEREEPVPASERHRAFNNQPVPGRIAVLAAGPMANFLFAILAYWLIFMIGVPGVRPIIGTVVDGSYAAQAGVSERDEIVAVGERDTGTWERAMLAMLDEMLDDGQIPLRVRGAEGRERSLTIDVGEDVRRLTEPGMLFEGLGISGWSPPLPARIGALVPDGAAAAAGLQPGDLVLSADGESIVDWRDWVEFVRERPGDRVEVEVRRDAGVQLVRLDIGSISLNGETIGRIGAEVDYPEDYGAEVRAEQRYGPVQAAWAGVVKTWKMSALTLRMFWNMIRGRVSPDNISGPINIASFAGATASIGLVPFVNFLAIVSISLGLINLMPVPMLDGGQIVYSAIEGIKGSPVSYRAEMIGRQLGVAMLLLLMSFAFYNDIARLVG